MILSSTEAREWLDSHITLSKTMFLLSRLKAGKSRHPQIWMVTGIQMLSDATVYSDRTGSAKTGANMQIPTPEVASAVIAAAGGDSKLAEAAISSSTGGFTNAEYHHEDERVWAAQFRRLKLDFVDGDAAQSETEEGKVSLDALLHLGLAGMKGGHPAGDETRHIAGVCDDDGTIGDEDAMTEEEARLFKRLKTASGKHALLIGGSEQSLNGVRTDLGAMANLLLERGFNVSLCYGSRATRRGIIEAWQALVKRIPKHSKDAVVVYYSGHGGASESANSREAYRIQYIVPYDVGNTTDSDFRGILDVELSYLVNRLTDRTHNVTIITDCCHSERIARGQPPIPGMRAWSPLTREVVESHVRRLREAGLYNQLNIEGNKYAVRLVAAESDKAAFETDAPRDLAIRGPGSGGSSMGRLTRELVLELKDIGEGRTTWDAVLPQLRLKLKEGQFQLPTIEGPMTRVLFSLERLDCWGKLPATAVNNKEVTLMGGELAGVQEDDEYAIMPSTALAPDPAEHIAVARVKDVWQMKAFADLEFRPGHRRFPQKIVAFPLRRPRPRYCVAIQASDAMLVRDLEKQIRPTYGGLSQDQEPFATVRHDGDKLVLIHRKEPNFEYPMATVSATGEAISDLIFQLEKLVTADQLLTLAPKHPQDLLDDSAVSVGIGRVRNRRAEACHAGELLVVEGQRAYFIVKNNGKSTLYASVFLVESMGTIHWLSYAHPWGVELRTGQEYVPGQPSHGWQNISEQKVNGQQHIWPESVPRRGTLDDAYVVVLTNRKADLSFWENQRRTQDEGKPKTLPEYDEGNGVEYLDDVQFCIKRIGFKLVPK